MLYMKRKERLCTLVEFLGVGRGTLGQDLFLQAVATNELVANTISRSQAHIVQHITLSNRAYSPDGVQSDEQVKNLGAHQPVAENNKKMVSNSQREVQNLDVSQEAEDVLAIAGVNPDDEAKFMFAKQRDRQRSDAALSNFRTQDKDPWRKIIELRIYARICGDDGLASSTGIAHVNEKVLYNLTKPKFCNRDKFCPNTYLKVYEFLEEALQVRLKSFVAHISICAARRNDANRSAFTKCQSAMEPKQKVRRINVNREREKGQRLEKERQALLRVGQSILSKRKRDFEDNSSLKERVTKVRQEEEERIRASVANEAARSALGDAKYLKWFEWAKTSDQPDGAIPSTLGSELREEHASDIKQDEKEAHKGVKGNRVEKLRGSGAAINSIYTTKSIILRVSQSF
mmetsp:Transcript_5467/g.13855  ORF Transcript_5467/g.13855 Transcript_5467/m.13855 type:complete len:402 (+) Transcript_5467:335-1540(+)